MLAEGKTNDRGEFTIRAPYIDIDELAMYLRLGTGTFPLPREDLDISYHAQLIIPCRDGGSYSPVRFGAGTSTST